VIQTLNLSGREIAILATMCLIAHNFIVESAVLKKTGSPVSRMVILRLASALLMGWILHFILPPSLGPGSAGQVLGENAAGIGLDLSLLPPVLLDWAKDMVPLILKIILIIFGLMFLQKILEEFGVIPWLGKVLGPLMTLFGLPPQTGYLWIVANMAGLVYGGAILIEQVRSNQVSISDAKLFNHHAAISHSQFEDTLLFMAVGVPFLWAALPRLILAVAVVWLERGRRILFRRSFRVRIVR
jgi:spore maturation protein SpmB